MYIHLRAHIWLILIVCGEWLLLPGCCDIYFIFPGFLFQTGLTYFSRMFSLSMDQALILWVTFSDFQAIKPAHLRGGKLMKNGLV